MRFDSNLVMKRATPLIISGQMRGPRKSIDGLAEKSPTAYCGPKETSKRDRRPR